METEAQDDRRIWVGNLDTRLTEYQLLKIVQKCGQIEKFDMLFHKNGPLVGQSRGYAFVTFKSADSSVKALEKLNGQYIGKKPLAVRLAKNLNYDELEKPKPRIEIPALGTRPPDSKISKEDAIRAIEAKLSVLEKRTLDDEIEMTNNSTTCQAPPIIQRYQFNKNNDGGNNSGQRGGFGTRTQFVKQRGSSKPYNRNHRPKRR